MKKFLFVITLGLSAIVVFFGLAEVVCAIFDKYTDTKKFTDYTISSFEIYKKHTSHISKLEKELFCDAIHFNDKGHELMASCVAKELKNFKFDSRSKIYAIGGSTTEGSDCGEKLRWTNLLENTIHQKVINLAKRGLNSTHNLEIEKNIDKNSIVFQGDWINEIIKSSNEKNYLRLFYYYLYKELKFFRLLVNIYTEKINFEQQHLDLYFNFRKDNLGNSEMVSFISDKEFVSSAIEMYEKNMKQLSIMRNENNLNIFIVNFPYVKNYYLNFSPQLNFFFESLWIPEIKKSQKKIAEIHNFNYLDIEKCFKNELLKFN